MWIKRLTSVIMGDFPGRISEFVLHFLGLLQVWFGKFGVRPNPVNLETVENSFEFIRHNCHRFWGA